METRDLAIKYKTLYKEIQMILNNIKKTGFDISEYNKMLIDIDNDINNDVKNITGVSYLKRANYEQDYAKGIGKLTKLKNYLESYNCYFKAYNSCKWIEIKIKDKNITNEDLEKYVSEMTLNLKSINESDTMDYENEKHIVEGIYKVAYELIKLELIMTGKSELYLYAKSEEVNNIYFDYLIQEDIDKLDLSDSNNVWLNEKIYENYKSGIYSSIFDIEVIKRILSKSDGIVLKEAIINNINDSLKKIEDNLKDINNCLKDATNFISITNTKKREVIEKRIDVIKPLVTIGLTLSLIIGGGFGIPKLSRKISTKDAYNKRSEIYSSVDGIVKSSEEKIFSSSEPTDGTIIRVYDPYKNEKIRKYTEYDVSFKEFDSLEEYYNYGIENYGIVGSEKTARKDYNDVISNYIDSYTEVINSSYEYLGKELNESDYEDGLVGLYVIYIIAILIADLIYYGNNWNGTTFIISKIKEIIETLPDYIDYTREYKYNNNKLKEEIEKLMTLINNNEILRNRFNELYENNKYLLDNEEELIRRISKLKNNETIENAKKLVKDNKRKN